MSGDIRYTRRMHFIDEPTEPAKPQTRGIYRAGAKVQFQNGSRGVVDINGSMRKADEIAGQLVLVKKLGKAERKRRKRECQRSRKAKSPMTGRADPRAR